MSVAEIVFPGPLIFSVLHFPFATLDFRSCWCRAVKLAVPPPGLGSPASSRFWSDRRVLCRSNEHCFLQMIPRCNINCYNSYYYYHYFFVIASKSTLLQLTSVIATVVITCNAAASVSIINTTTSDDDDNNNSNNNDIYNYYYYFFIDSERSPDPP